MIPAPVAAALNAFTGPIESAVTAGGGTINLTLLLTGGDGRRWFLKLNDASRVDMFAAEAAGLEELAAANAIRVPTPLTFGTTEDQAYLLLEYLDIGHPAANAAAELGRRLAAQHRVTQPRFGWRCDNTIGSTPQHNTWCDDWLEFWRQRRLGYQLNLAVTNGYGHILRDDGDVLLDGLPRLLAGHEPAASLLHGDLWGGNWGVLATGEPVTFDPAVYYGDREADLAMTRLFGGFAPEFYAAYEASWPLPAGHELRTELYKLYHMLNHLNLFGLAYASQTRAIMDRLLRALRG